MMLSEAEQVFGRRCWLGVSCLLFSTIMGCGAGEQQELSVWMQNERNSVKSEVVPLSEPKPFEPVPYSVAGQMEPYAIERLASILRGEKGGLAGGSALIEAEERRRKQPLEAFPLDAIKMVGSLNRGGKLVALVKVNDLLYQVGVGSYMGQNFGLVRSVTENELVLREVVQDVSGEWTERVAALQLVEESSK